MRIPAARIVATGCYATRCADEVAALPGVAAGRAPTTKGAGAVRRRLVRSLWRARDSATARAAGRCAGADGPDGVDAARADRLRGVVQLLHHPDDARARAGAGRSPTCWRKSSASSTAGYKEIVDHRRASGLVRTRPAAARRRWELLLTRLLQRSRRRLFRISSLEPMDCPRELLDLAEATASVTRVAAHASRRTSTCRCSTPRTAC